MEGMVAETPLLPILREEIRAAGGRITFARFMELCLYHPQHGYYNTERVKLGARGDFYTSAHAGPVFARLLAIHFHQLWRELHKPTRFDLVELGPGDGALAVELLPWIAKRFPEFSSRLYYTAVEQSAVLRTRLEERLAAFADRARILDDMPSPASNAERITGCIFANEFFDALPVHILVWRGGHWLERYVCLKDDAFEWCEDAPSSLALEQAAHSGLDQSLNWNQEVLDGVPEQWFAEVAPSAEGRMARMGRLLDRGEALIVDYGYRQEEWHAGRFPEGTVLAYRGHQAVHDLLASPGEQDLTAHVNFTQLTEAGRTCGLQSCRSREQGSFLMGLGEPDEFHDVFADCASDLGRQKRAQQLKTLILPQGMGETFHVLQFRKNL